MAMTPEAVAICLRDDPTFATSTREEQEAEAAALLGSDDPLDVAIAIELALEGAPAPVAIMGPGDEGCRLEKPCAAPRIAGNGRCMDCGAYRQSPATSPVEREEPLEAPAPPSEPENAPARSGDAAGGVAEKPAPARRKKPVSYAEAHRQRQAKAMRDPEATFIGRYKELTGTADRELAAMTGKSRATIQAYARGQLPEKLEPETIRHLADDIGERMILLAQLQRDMLAAIGEVD